MRPTIKMHLGIPLIKGTKHSGDDKKADAASLREYNPSLVGHIHRFDANEKPIRLPG